MLACVSSLRIRPSLADFEPRIVAPETINRHASRRQKCGRSVRCRKILDFYFIRQQRLSGKLGDSNKVVQCSFDFITPIAHFVIFSHVIGRRRDGEWHAKRLEMALAAANLVRLSSPKL